MLGRALFLVLLLTLVAATQIEEDTLVLFFPTYTLDSASEHQQALRSLLAIVGDGAWPALRVGYAVPNSFEEHIAALQQVELKVHATSSADGQVYTARELGRQMDNVAGLEGWNSLRQNEHAWITTHSPHACNGQRCRLPKTPREQVIMAFANCMLDLRTLNFTGADVRFVFVTLLQEQAGAYREAIEEVRARLWPEGGPQPILHFQEVGSGVSFNVGHRLSIWPFADRVGNILIQQPNYLTIAMET